MRCSPSCGTRFPDVTAADLDRWRTEATLNAARSTVRSGISFREPGVLLRVSPEAKRRRDQHAASQPSTTTTQPTPDERLREHLSRVIAEAKKTGKPEVTPIRHRITYKLTVLPNRPGAKAGSLLRCWLPFPQAYRQQKDVRLIRSSPSDGTVAASGRPGARLDGPFTGAAQRTVYFEQKIADPGKR